MSNMRRPKLPEGKVLVLCNSFFNEWQPDVVPEIFDHVSDAQDWIKMRLRDEPGDLYIIVEPLKTYWAQVSIRVEDNKR